MSSINRNEPKGVELKGKSVREGLKLTPDLLKSHIAEVIYEDREVGGHRVITCHFKMDNGFIVWGKNSSTSIDPANFDEELGKKLAHEKTFSQLWELEAYRAVVEKQMIEEATVVAKIDTNQYISERGNICQMRGVEYREGRGQNFVFRHPRDNGPGISANFVNTDNERYDKKRNGEAYAQVEAYIRSFMTPDELYSQLVVRLAKTCVAAYCGMSANSTPWTDMNNQERQECCDHIKRLLLAPADYIPLDTKDILFKSIVDSYK
ncbi:hypothetical protein DEEACLCL_00199 [Salmonella phage CRW-SP2]|nr:hypothetical protein DEEACLCL_00199 [Salmonella phage CRW-SP2]